MFHVLLCYSAFSDAQTNHKNKNLTIKTSELNTQFTHLNIGKHQNMYFFGNRNLPFLWPINSIVIGSSCCNTVPVTHLNTASVLVSGFWKRESYFVYDNHLKQNGGCFVSIRLSWKNFQNFSGYIGWRLTMNNKSEPEGRRDADQSRKPRTQLQKNSEFFEKLEQIEQK